MRAARWYARGDIRIDTVHVPSPAPDEALIRVLYCGICGTDLEEFRDGPVTIPTSPHPVSGHCAPLTLGHEVVGQVVIAAADGSGPPVGQIVIPDVVVGCGTCWWCARHEDGLCERLSVRGQTDDGGLADYMLARARTCLAVPSSLEPAIAAFAEPLAVAVRAVRKCVRPMGVRAAVLGGGTVGQLVAQVLVANGASQIIVVDPVAERRSTAEQSKWVKACSPEDFAAIVASIPQPGLDVVFECTGRPTLLATAVGAVRSGGLVVAVGLHSGGEPVPLVDLVLGEKTVVGSAAHVWDVDVALALELLASGQVDCSELLTHQVPLSNLVSEGLSLLADPDSGAMKVLIDCA